MEDSPLPSSLWDFNAEACFQVRLCAACTAVFAISGSSSPYVMEDYPRQPSSCSLYYALQLWCLEVFELEVVMNVA